MYEKSDFDGYSLYFFYIEGIYEDKACWLWDEDKLLYNEALSKYPKSEYQWEEIIENW